MAAYYKYPWRLDIEQYRSSGSIEGLLTEPWRIKSLGCIAYPTDFRRFPSTKDIEVHSKAVEFMMSHRVAQLHKQKGPFAE
jgi:hypothetical protein